MVSSNKLKLFAATLFATAAFTGCCTDDFSDGEGGQGGNETKVVLPEGDKWVMFGDDAQVSGSVVELNSAIYDIEEDGTYTFYFTEDYDVTTVDGMLAADGVLVISGVSNPAGKQTGTPVTYNDLTHAVSSENYGDQSVNVTLDAEAVEMYVELTNGNGAENFRAKYTGECPEAALVDVENAVAVGKDKPTPIESVVEFRNEETGMWTYYFYAEPDVTTVDEASALLVVTLPKDYVEGAVAYEEGEAPEFVQSFDSLAEGTEVEFTNLRATYAEGGEGELYAGIVDDPSGAAMRQLELIYNNGDTLVRMNYNGVVTIVIDASNTAERTYGYSEEAVETALEGNVYSYTDAKGKYLIYSSVANAKSLADLKAEGYTVVFNMPNGEGVFEEMPTGFAATAYDYSIDGGDETLKSYFVNNNPQGTPAITDTDKAYLTSKKLNMNEDGFAGFTYTTAGNSVYFAFEGTLTPEHNPMVRPSFRSAEPFKAEYFGSVTAIEGSDDLHETLAPAGAGENGSYIKVTDKEGYVVFQEEITQVFVLNDYRKVTMNGSTVNVLRTPGGGPFFGMRVFFDSASTNNDHSTYGTTPNLSFACDERTGSELNQLVSGAPVKQCTVVTGEEITLDHDVTYSSNMVQSGYQYVSDNDQLFSFTYNKQFTYWKETDMEDSKPTGRISLDTKSIGSPYSSAYSATSSPSMATGTTTKGSMKISHDESSDVWSIDFNILDNVKKYSSYPSPSWSESGTGLTVEIHFEGTFTK